MPSPSAPGWWQRMQCLSSTGWTSVRKSSGEEPSGPISIFDGSRMAARGGRFWTVLDVAFQVRCRIDAHADPVIGRTTENDGRDLPGLFRGRKRAFLASTLSSC